MSALRPGRVCEREVLRQAEPWWFFREPSGISGPKRTGRENWLMMLEWPGGPGGMR